MRGAPEATPCRRSGICSLMSWRGVARQGPQGDKPAIHAQSGTHPTGRLETNDVDLDAGTMRLMGKGRRERIAFLSPKAARPSTATCACAPDTIPPRSPTCGWARRGA